jgi:penicillin-binding protein 2
MAASARTDARTDQRGRAHRSSLFDRRVGALALVGLGLLFVLVLQLARLGIVEHDAHAANVERYLVRKRLLPSSRGRILDRRGEVLATDRASWDVLLEYDAISGRWATTEAQRALVRELGRSAWLELSPLERARMVLERQQVFDARLEAVFARMMVVGGLSREELDRRLDEVMRRAARESKSRKEALVARELALYGEDARLAEIDRERVASQLDAHVVLPDVAEDVAFEFQRLAEDMRGALVVEPSTRRWNPWEQVAFTVDRTTLPSPIRSKQSVDVVLNGVADHLLGATRSQVFPDDLKRRPMLDPMSGAIVDLGGYRADRDVVGSSGVEARFEDLLRGSRGVVERDLEQESEQVQPPVNGRDVRMTIDIRVQARVQALFDPKVRLAQIQQYQRGYDAEGAPRGGPLPVGWQLDGAVVVLEIATGDVLAAVSAPTIAEGTAMSAEDRAREHPEIFRPFAGVYPPGSILKPLVLCAAAAERLVRPNEQIECHGHFFEDERDAVRCWIYRPTEGRSGTHGRLDAAEALARSCNIYFYELARRLGPERLIAWLERFGLAQVPTDALPQRSSGSLPQEDDLAKIRADRDRVSPVLLGIGQGPLTWTPLHAADAFATIARGGVRLAPRLVLDQPSAAPVDLGIPRFAIDDALRGLAASVNEDFGTGHHMTLEGGRRETLFDMDGVQVWGKTGTATAPKLKIDGSAIQTDHAWFVGLVGAKGDSPRYAIAVLLEHGGSGGKVAGPMAAQVMRALAAEGYLGDRAQQAVLPQSQSERGQNLRGEGNE